MLSSFSAVFAFPRLLVRRGECLWSFHTIEISHRQPPRSNAFVQGPIQPDSTQGQFSRSRSFVSKPVYNSSFTLHEETSASTNQRGSHVFETEAH